MSHHSFNHYEKLTPLTKSLQPHPPRAITANHPTTAPTNNDPFFSPQNPQVILSHSQENPKLKVTHNNKERQRAPSAHPPWATSLMFQLKTMTAINDKNQLIVWVVFFLQVMLAFTINTRMKKMISRSKSTDLSCLHRWWCMVPCAAIVPATLKASQHCSQVPTTSLDYFVNFGRFILQILGVWCVFYLFIIYCL